MRRQETPGTGYGERIVRLRCEKWVDGPCSSILLLRLSSIQTGDGSHGLSMDHDDDLAQKDSIWGRSRSTAGRQLGGIRLGARGLATAGTAAA